MALGKHVTSSVLLQAIRSVHKGGGRQRPEERVTAEGSLSLREREVMQP